MTRSPWPAADPELLRFIEGWKATVSSTYREDPLLLEEHARQENSFRTSGYSRRQVTELVQNAADAIFKSGTTGRIEIRLTDDHLYCANDGQEFSKEGIEAITHAYLSDKRGGEIGRYGLGFKSVLAVSDNPQIFSRSASFEFGSEGAREALEGFGAPEDRLPVLRLATPLDAGREIADDSTLESLAHWATTIVRLPLSRHAELEEQLLEFQTQFLIFTPHVSELAIKTDLSGTHHEYIHTCTPLGSSTYEIQGPRLTRQEWAIFTRDHHPSPAAREGVDDAIARKTIRLTCAMPVGSRGREGQFWANFPLSERTSAAGIFNAPWALSEDRSHILADKRYNAEIFETFARLFVESLPALSTGEDPGRHLQYLPSRPQEYHSEADRALISEIHRHAASAALIPDAEGTLRRGTEIVALNHDVQLPMAAMEAWSMAPHTRTNVPHITCYRNDKTGQVRVRLRELHRRAFADAGALLQRTLPSSPNELGLPAWLNELTDTQDPNFSRTALRIVRSIDSSPDLKSAGSARIVPTTSGRRAYLSERERVHLPPQEQVDLSGFELVIDEVAQDPVCLAVLSQFGFKPIDQETVFKSALRGMADGGTDEQWATLWDHALNLKPRQLALVLEDWLRHGNVVKVMTTDGSWRDSNQVYSLKNPDISIPWADRELAKNFLPNPQLTDVLGIVTKLSNQYPVIEESVFELYKDWAVEQARLADAEDQDSEPGRWQFAEERGTGPIDLLRDLSQARPHPTEDVVKLTSAMVKSEGERTWHLHSPDGETFEIPAPHLWAAMEWGWTQTTFGLRPCVETASPLLRKFGTWVPAAIELKFQILTLPNTLDDLAPEVLVQGFRSGSGAHATDETTGSLVDFLTEALPLVADGQQWTEELPAVVDGSVHHFPASQIFVASQPDQIDALNRLRRPYLHVQDPRTREVLFENADFQDAEQAIRFELMPLDPGDPVLLTDCIPTVHNLLDRKDRRLTITHCSSIVSRQITPDGVQEEYHDRKFDDGTIYVTSDPSTRDGAHGLLTWINREVGLRLSAGEVDTAVENLRRSDAEEIKEKCRAARTNAERLRILVTPQQLAAKLPSGLLDTLNALDTPVQDQELAGLFLDSFGADSLRSLADELRELRLNPPDQWGGRGPARQFVTDLGFPPEFAGTARPSHVATETVMGKPGLGELHDYQREALKELRFLLRSNPGNADKALLELPTGAGKTRVAVESLVKAFLNNDFQTDGPVLWIAQSEELCEQAITTWSEVWRQFSDERSLSINRFFGSHKPFAPEIDLSVVVATDAMLYEHLADDSYDWVYSPVAVVVDEAHRAADNKTYRQIFQRLGVDLEHKERPLIGLSATPYRGRSEDDTRMLARRFGNNLVQTLGDNPIAELQYRGVLARIDHKVLPGSRLSVEKSEIDFNKLSQGTLTRVGQDQRRTMGIVNDILSLPEDWKVLVFMPSVLSAQVLATILKKEGVSAASVSGQSSRGQRASVISDFKKGDLQVLVNCDLLTQGFDAPQVRALYVARPTLSDGNYVQMVGRGLRGPKNGGSERCLVVNLEDTIDNVDIDLAYQGFTKYWRVENS